MADNVSRLYVISNSFPALYIIANEFTNDKHAKSNKVPTESALPDTLHAFGVWKTDMVYSPDPGLRYSLRQCLPSSCRSSLFNRLINAMGLMPLLTPFSKMAEPASDIITAGVP